MKKKITVRYFAMMGEKRGTQNETYETEAGTARQLLHELQANKALPLTTNISRAVVNDKFVDWDSPISDGDLVILMSPFSGG
ncbi:MAG: MoaD/ThiS family protein [Elusimicrobia bacterium]|nr:MoaD/ThiS family protein [Elusimicrobiota bacterium]